MKRFLVLLLILLSGQINTRVYELENKVDAYVVRVEHESHYGTAFFVTHKGRSFLVTNEHVCSSKENRYTISSPIFEGKPVFRAIKKDKNIDLCVLSVKKGKEGLVIAKHIRIFDAVGTTGFPNAIGPRSSRGMITHIGPDPAREMMGKVIISTAVVDFGSSGSPLYNHDYEVVGVISQKYMTEPLSLAIHRDSLIKFLESIP